MLGVDTEDPEIMKDLTAMMKGDAMLLGLDVASDSVPKDSFELPLAIRRRQALRSQG